jgi:uncharacterized protein (DUF697 family)
MSLDPREFARAKLREAIDSKKDRDEKADAVIWAAVAINAGMGALPFGINTWTFIGVVTVMVTFLGTAYGYHLSNDGASKILKNIFTSVGITFCMFTLGMKFFVEVLKGAGVFTMGGATAVGMALDAALCGAVTYAVGFTTKEYFQKGQKMTPEEINARFRQAYAEGQSKVRERKAG